MWSFGVVLLQIISGCQVDRNTDLLIVTKNNKSKIAKGLFALPKNVLEDDEACDDHKDDHLEEDDDE